MYILPNRENKIWTQFNDGDTRGLIHKSINLDLVTNPGKIRATATQYTTFSNPANSLSYTPMAIKYFNGKFLILDDGGVWSSSNIEGPYTRETSGTDPTSPDSTISDMDYFNNAIYVTDDQDIYKLSAAFSWSRPITGSLTSDTPHILETYGNRLYVTNDLYKVYSLNTSDSLATSGTSTLDLGLANNFVITMLKAAYDRLWVGVLDIETGAGLVYEWDGETENTPSRRYNLDAGVVAGTVLDNIPYFIDSYGRLMAYGGASFIEVGRLPRSEYGELENVDNDTHFRFVHVNGITTTTYGTLLVNVGSMMESDSYNYNSPSGVYEYMAGTGLCHKFSSTFNKYGDTVYDNGHILAPQAGAVAYFAEGGRGNDTRPVLFGVRNGGNDQSANYLANVPINNQTNTRYGVLETTWLQANGVDDVWQKIYLKYRKLKNSTDKIIVKYRVDYDEPTYIQNVTWTSSTTFTTTTNLSNYSAGDEVALVAGVGSPKMPHISSISEAGGTYTVTLDETITGATGTGSAYVAKWKKLGTVNDTWSRYKEFVISEDSNSPEIQFKVCMDWKGDNELSEIVVVNKNNQRII